MYGSAERLRGGLLYEADTHLLSPELGSRSVSNVAWDRDSISISRVAVSALVSQHNYSSGDID